MLVSTLWYDAVEVENGHNKLKVDKVNEGQRRTTMTSKTSMSKTRYTRVTTKGQEKKAQME